MNFTIYFDQYISRLDVINNCLERSKQYDLILSDEELKTTKDMIKILEVFEKATYVFQGSEYPTLNMTMIWRQVVISQNFISEQLRDSNSIQISVWYNYRKTNLFRA